MNKLNKIIVSAFSFLALLFFVLSLIDTHEGRKKTNFNLDNVTTHVEKLSENGPRSIADKKSNQKALEYIESQVAGFGAVNEDIVDKPAYLIQDFVAEDEDYQNWYLKNLILHIPANSKEKSNEALMFMAHFDSVPMGNGSSDDAVAIGVMLEAARYYIDKMNNGFEIKNDLVFCFVNGEEYGLYGSYAFMDEFKGFNNIVDRINFGTNLESRGTSGTLIMFETAKNNYNTVKLFSKLNKNIFTCSIATMVYDMMPNGTDFSNFKDAYQGLNMANINGGENYHTQNDNVENIGISYLSQQAQIVDILINNLASYDLNKLYDASESAVFFSYLNITTVVYNHVATIIFAVIGILMLVANILVSIFYRKENNVKNTSKGILVIILGLLASALAAFICYFIFQLIASMFGVINIHMLNTITYSNTAIVIGLGILILGLTALASYLGCKLLNIKSRDITRAFSYIHVFLGIVLSFVLKDASYLFMFSGIMLMINELLITCIKKCDISKYHGEILAVALYFPIVIPVLGLAISALGLTMSYVYGLLFALAIFALGTALAPLCKYASIRSVIKLVNKENIEVSVWEGSLHIIGVALIIFFVVSLIRPNASVNLQGKQNIAKLPYDDALVYVLDENDNYEYRIYDLNAYNALKDYAPKMKYTNDYYVGNGEEIEVKENILSTFNTDSIEVNKINDNTLVYLEFINIDATSFTISDGITTKTYELNESYKIKIHSNCTVTINGGKANVLYKEVLRDYAPLIPDAYKNDDEMLHFNLWLTKKITLAK